MKSHLLTLGSIALALVLLFSMPLSRQTNASASDGFVLQAASSSPAKKGRQYQYPIHTVNEWSQRRNELPGTTLPK